MIAENCGFNLPEFQAFDNSSLSKKNYRISNKEVQEITVQITADLDIFGFEYLIE